MEVNLSFIMFHQPLYTLYISVIFKFNRSSIRGGCGKLIFQALSSNNVLAITRNI